MNNITVERVDEWGVTLVVRGALRSVTWAEMRDAAGPDNAEDLRVCYVPLLRTARNMAHAQGLSGARVTGFSPTLEDYFLGTIYTAAGHVGLVAHEPADLRHGPAYGTMVGAWVVLDCATRRQLHATPATLDVLRGLPAGDAAAVNDMMSEWALAHQNAAESRSFCLVWGVQ